MQRSSLPLAVGDTFIPNSIHYGAALYAVEDVHYAQPDTIYWVRSNETGRAMLMLSGKIFNKTAHYQKLTNGEIVRLARTNDRTAIIEFVKRFKHYPQFVKK